MNSSLTVLCHVAWALLGQRDPQIGIAVRVILKLELMTSCNFYTLQSHGPSGGPVLAPGPYV